MSQFKKLENIKKLKEEKQNNIYFAQINEYGIKKSQDILFSGTKKYKRNIYSSERNNNRRNLEIDSDLIMLWDKLKVTNEFQKKFSQKINFFSPEYQKLIIESEKQQCKKTYDLISKIVNEAMLKDRDIETLRTLQIFSYSKDEKNLNEIKKKLISLKYHLINFLQSINELRNISFVDIFYGKIDIESTNLYNYIKPDYFFKLNQELKEIQESNLGKIFKINEVYDILLMDFDEEKIYEKKRNYVAYQVFINEFIHLNYNPKKNKNYFKNLEKTNIDAGKNLKKSKSKELIYLKKKKNDSEISTNKNQNKDISDDLPVPEVDDNYINEDKSKNKNLQFYIKDISKFKDIYMKYYNTIPNEQKIIFNIKEDLMEYTKGINPMFIIKKNYGDITYFCSLEYSNEDENTLHISNFSINNNEIKNGIEELIKFLNEKKIIYQYLTIDLYYENKDGKLILNKDINNIFKNIKFKWTKLENKEEGIRYQKMKYTNPDYIENTFIDNYAMNFISGLIIYHGKNKMELIKNSKEFDFNFNNFNLNVLEKINDNKDEDLKKINSFCKNIHFNHCNDLSEINQILNLENLNIKLPSIDNENKILYDLFKVNTQFDSLLSLKINEKRYFRINSPIKVLIEKETQQKLYMIIMKDGNYLIIGQPNKKFNKLLNKEKNNIYKIFQEINQKIEQVDEEINSIYIPEINYEMISKGNYIENSSINDIQQIYSFYKFYQNTEKNNYTIKISPNEKDIVINDTVFISIINIDITREFEIPSIFCALLNK